MKGLAKCGLLTASMAVVNFSIGASAEAVTVTFEDGSTDPFGAGTYNGTEDVMLASFGSENFGKRANMEIGELEDFNLLRHSLIRFDVTSMAGQFSSIDSVVLKLFISNIDGLGGSDIQGKDDLQLFRLADANTGWVEGTGVSSSAGSPPATGESTWKQRVQDAANWAGSAGASTAGTDYLTPELGSVAFDSSDEANIEGTALEIVFNDVSFFSDWVQGNNAGLFLRTELENDTAISVFSSDATNLNFRPELQVSFTEGTPIPTPALLPGLIGFGASIIRKRKRAASVAV